MKPLLAIVGMGEGVSLAVSQRFAQAGFAIAMVARNEAKLQGFKAMLQAEGYDAHYFVADAGDEASLKAAFAAMRSAIGNPEVLVYNAAVPRMEHLLNETADHLISDFKVNVAGALVAVQNVLPAMRTNQQGTILLTGGGFSLYPSPEFASLSIGKAGIRSLAKMLGEALKDEGIRAGTITIAGIVSSNDPKYNPEKIAEAYWAFHTAPSPESEVVY